MERLHYQENTTYWMIFILINLIAIIIFTQFPLNTDESVFLYAGKQMQKNLIYRDIQDNKPIGIFLISALSQMTENVFFARALTYAVNICSALIVYQIGKKLWDTKKGIIASLIFICGIYIFEGYYFVTEPFTVFFATLSIYFLLTRKMVLSGFATGTTFLFNQTASILLLTIVFYFILYTIYYPLTKKKDAILFFAGLSIPVVVLLIVLNHYNLFKHYIYCTVTLTGGWKHPFEIDRYIKALVLFFPVWIITVFSLKQFLKDFSTRNTKNIFLKTYLILGILYILTTYAGKHVILLLPSLSLISATTMKEIWHKRLILIIFSLFLMNSCNSAIGDYNGIERQIDEANCVDKYIQGDIFTLPFNLYIPYFSNDSKLGTRWAGFVYSKEIVKIVLDDFEHTDINYVIMEKKWEDKYLEGEDTFFESNEILYQYMLKNYFLFAETTKYSIYKKMP